jgi:hypothetical protein
MTTITGIAVVECCTFDYNLHLCKAVTQCNEQKHDHIFLRCEPPKDILAQKYGGCCHEKEAGVLYIKVSIQSAMS